MICLKKMTWRKNDMSEKDDMAEKLGIDREEKWYGTAGNTA